MSLGSGPLENADWQVRVDKLAAQADGPRSARLAGYKSPLRRLLERLWPHRQGPGGGSHLAYSTLDDPDH
jgi:hypothetical protein